MSKVSGVLSPADFRSQQQNRIERHVRAVHRPCVHDPKDSLPDWIAGLKRRKRLVNRVDLAWVPFIDSMANWTFMVTITFRRISHKGFKVTHNTIVKALRHMLRLVNCDLFGKRRTNKGWTIAAAAVSDFGESGDHPHAHVLLEAPENISESQLAVLVERAAKRIFLIGRQRFYRQYNCIGGSAYLIEHGTDRMVVSLTTRAYQGG